MVQTLYSGPPDELMQYLSLTQLNGQQLLSVIGDILDISKLEANRMQLSRRRVALRQLVEETTATARFLAQKRGVQVECRVETGDAELDADPVRVRQVLTNLLDNAVKFSDAGGVVAIDVREQGDGVVVEVSDRGIGIEEKEHDKVFMSFYQVSGGDTRRAGGTGVGLAIAKQLVELHGGRIWLKSKLGEGSSFYVFLPRAEAANSTARRSAPPPRPGVSPHTGPGASKSGFPPPLN
jgi:signal transduction histidine kinase